MFNIGPAELIVILLVALLVVGPKRLPQLGRTIGKSMREFRKASEDFKQSMEFGVDEDDFPEEKPDGQEPTETTTHPPKPDQPHAS